MSSFGRPLLTFADKVQQLTAIVVQSLIKFALSLKLKSEGNCAPLGGYRFYWSNKPVTTKRVKLPLKLFQSKRHVLNQSLHLLIVFHRKMIVSKAAYTKHPCNQEIIISSVDYLILKENETSRLTVLNPRDNTGLKSN